MRLRSQKSCLGVCFHVYSTLRPPGVHASSSGLVLKLGHLCPQPRSLLPSSGSKLTSVAFSKGGSFQKVSFGDKGLRSPRNRAWKGQGGLCWFLSPLKICTGVHSGWWA